MINDTLDLNVMGTTGNNYILGCYLPKEDSYFPLTIISKDGINEDHSGFELFPKPKVMEVSINSIKKSGRGRQYNVGKATFLQWRYEKDSNNATSLDEMETIFNLPSSHEEYYGKQS
jgi:hypothetical protein